MDWDSLKIIDYISVMEDMWRKLDVKDVNCQKRILCELHQNELALGPAASKIVNVFGYFFVLNLNLNTIFHICTKYLFLLLLLLLLQVRPLFVAAKHSRAFEEHDR